MLFLLQNGKATNFRGPRMKDILENVCIFSTIKPSRPLNPSPSKSCVYIYISYASNAVALAFMIFLYGTKITMVSTEFVVQLYILLDSKWRPLKYFN